MRESRSQVRIPLQVSRGCVVASIQVDLTEAVLRTFRQDLLELIHSSGSSGVILDVSGVEIMDADDFDAVRRSMAMAELMGARCIVSGLRPGVVSALIDLDVDSEGVDAVLNLDEAFRRMDEMLGRVEVGQDTDETEAGEIEEAPADIDGDSTLDDSNTDSF
jgi:rsbT antagonist protein RsbS